ncbi:MAG TPA: hypothetical protein VMM84_04205 [Pyrinomonadaceae bacterium]|nr:hypothetical protein [Pyrinomonadaceae bacterium]
MTYCKPSGGQEQLFLVESGQQSNKIFAGESPAKGRSGLFIVLLESQQSLLEMVQGGEVIGSEHFSLDDREIDLDLIEPTSMDRRVHEMGIGPMGAQSLDCFLAAVRGAQLSMIQKTRLADLYGSWDITVATNRSTGAMPFLGSQRPKSLARCTSQAAK